VAVDRAYDIAVVVVVVVEVEREIIFNKRKNVDNAVEGGTVLFILLRETP